MNFRGATYAFRLVLRQFAPPAAAAASGVLLGLALPPRGGALLAWIALVPLLYYVRRSTAPIGLMLGMIAGLCTAVVGFGIPRSASALAVLAPVYGSAVLLLALLSGSGAALRHLDATWWAFVIAVLAVTAELSTFSLIPLHLALCLWRIPALLQLAAITGIWGVSFLLWWFNAGLAVSRSQDMRPLTGPAILAVLAALLGSRFIGPPPTQTQSVLLTAIQTNRFDHATLLRLGRPTRRKGSRLLTFAMHTGSADAAAPDSAERELARLLRGYLVLGCMQAAGNERYHAAVILSPRGRLRGMSSQIHLACRDRAYLHPGLCAGAAALPIGYIGMPINLDTCYTDACHNLALQSVDCFCSPTDDPPAPRNSLNILHAAFYPFRSIENGVPSVRADTRAFSLITDRFGRIVALSQKQGVRALLGIVDSEVRHTPYRRLGDSFAWGCVALKLLLLCGSAGHVYLDYRNNANAS